MGNLLILKNIYKGDFSMFFKKLFIKKKILLAKENEEKTEEQLLQEFKEEILKEIKNKNEEK